MRPYDWQFGASVQQELLPRVSLEVSYNRRWFGNFFVTDNILTKASDYNVDADGAAERQPAEQRERRPPTSTSTPAAVGEGAQNYQTFETDYAPARTQVLARRDDQPERPAAQRPHAPGGHEHRPRRVGYLRARDKHCRSSWSWRGVNQQLASCHVDEPWATSFRGLAAYTVPKIDVLVSANIRSVPNANIGMGSNSATNGASRNANYNVPNTVVQQSLGRLPAGGLATGNTTVNLLIPGELYGPRVTQVDMRFAKVLKFRGTRADVGLDLYNLFNTSDQVGFIETYDFATNGATYMQPNAIVAPRFVRFNIRVNF